VSLHQRAQAPGDAGLHADRFAWPRGAEDFDRAERRQFQAWYWRDDRIVLGYHAGQLGGGFDQQHTGKQRVTRKMTPQPGFVAAQQVFTHAFLPGIEA
jgi:hypothetical protein